jgi:hypothetical protein
MSTDQERHGETQRTVHLGPSPLAPAAGPVTGRLDDVQGERCYVVENLQELAPFLLTLVSDSDHWLFAASNGALTAGRRSPATALFPYVTEDRVIDSVGVSGPVTALVARVRGRHQLWRPLRGDDQRLHRIARRLSRNVLGNRLVLEESNLDLGLTFRAGWTTSHAYGFLRDCEVVNEGAEPVELEVVDGLVNLLPAGIDDLFQNTFSVLADAYKRAERIPGTPLAVFALEAVPTDKAEPREALRATTVWSHGLPEPRVLLDAAALERFERGQPLGELEEPGARLGARGAYLLGGRARLAPGEAARWHLVADVNRTQFDVAALAAELADPDRTLARAQEDVARGRERLLRIVAGTDGLQRTDDELATAHHLLNVLFNDMRGGVPAGDGAVPGPDLAAFVRRMSPATGRRHAAFLDALGERERRGDLLARVEALGDPDLLRLALEHLPLTFSRRHGDPSRPWNRFEIDVRGEGGEERIAYQGNWRDIFQNWEALALSWPELLEGFIARFVNASTADGHNPYRISSDGVEWEIPDPSHPWAAIGYWGDHQLVYLQRLLDLSRRHHPGRLAGLLRRRLFTYVDVPYELAPYDDVLRDPRATIRFDREKHRRILELLPAEGGDARLLRAGEDLHRVTLGEKLLVPALAKLANLVPGAGIWMNTQRPEWNDANNALVGHGLSVVTLCHLASYLATFHELLGDAGEAPVLVSPEVAAWLEETIAALVHHRALLAAREVGDRDRATFVSTLGRIAARYREVLYRDGLSAPIEVPVASLERLAELGLAYARHGLTANRRTDGLYHAYNLLAPRPDGGFGVERLPEMLEGQAAALGSGLIEGEEALGVLQALRRSALWRSDQRSYLLYPERRLAGFLERNVIPEEVLRESPALRRLLEPGEGNPGAGAPGERILRRDASGRARFRETLDGDDRIGEAVRALQREGVLDAAGAAEVLAAYERVFQHRRFTGRSGTMYGYEGLGCIYWHMVGKLLVAAQERCFAAAEAGAGEAVVARLAAAYHELRAGMAGTRKTPAEYGAIPLDPYSHTPRRGGARQPGMTGQVKEEILARRGELGVRVRDGRIRFWPLLLRASELLARPAQLELPAADGSRRAIPLEAGTLAFTLCEVPVVYRRRPEAAIAVVGRDGGVRRTPGDRLDPATSAAVFGRTGDVAAIEVDVAVLYDG